MKIFIGCSSSDNIPKEYFDDCKVLLEELMSKNDLVFGACNSGLMGLSYDIALSQGRSITGICPEAYKDDFKMLSCDIEITTKTVCERIEKIISSSDAFIFLPGGLGTINEFFAVLESKRCHEFDKPIVLYDSNGYFKGLLEYIDEIYKERFLGFKDRDNYLITDDKNLVINYIKRYDEIQKMGREPLMGSFEAFCRNFRDYRNNRDKGEDPSIDAFLKHGFSRIRKP